MSTNTHTSSVGSNECYPDVAKLSRKGLPNYEHATGHMATALSAAPPRPRVGIDEEDPDSADEDDTDEEDNDSADEDDTDSSDEEDTDEEDNDSADEDDTTLLSGPHSGDKRLSSSCFQRKKDKKKRKMDRVDELIIKVCSIMSKKLELKLAKKQSEYGKEDTTLSGPHSGDKRKEDEKKRKMNPVHEAIIKTCSLMTKNLEFKPATKQSECGKGKETDSFLSDPYGMKVCLDIIQEMDMDMVLRVKALNWLMVSGPELQKTFVKMNPSFRLDWLMKHVG